jgi:probable addiction module antidote protein
MKKYRKFTELLDEYLHDKEFAAEFLSQALEEEDFSTFLLSLKDVVRVHGSITSVAEQAHISRSTIYKLFSEKANPELKTILALLHPISSNLLSLQIGKLPRTCWTRQCLLPNLNCTRNTP